MSIWRISREQTIRSVISGIQQLDLMPLIVFWSVLGRSRAFSRTLDNSRETQFIFSYGHSRRTGPTVRNQPHQSHCLYGVDLLFMYTVCHPDGEAWLEVVRENKGFGVAGDLQSTECD